MKIAKIARIIFTTHFRKNICSITKTHDFLLKIIHLETVKQPNRDEENILFRFINYEKSKGNIYIIQERKKKRKQFLVFLKISNNCRM